MRHFIAATAVVGFLASGLASPQVKTATPIPVVQPPNEEARRITREEAIKLIKAKKAVFVDVRGKDQYDQSHIKGALSIPLGDILIGIRQIPPKTFIITYCA
jgi:3-mercaptopyruvate sulfurtransferase SseA